MSPWKENKTDTVRVLTPVIFFYSGFQMGSWLTVQRETMLFSNQPIKRLNNKTPSTGFNLADAL